MAAYEEQEYDKPFSIKVWGKMLYKLGGEGSDPTLGLAKWSQVPSEKADCYRNAEVTVVSAGQVVRQFVLPNAFVMEYSEEIDDESGVGTFYIHMKQKKINRIFLSGKSEFLFPFIR